MGYNVEKTEKGGFFTSIDSRIVKAAEVVGVFLAAYACFTVLKNTPGSVVQGKKGEFHKIQLNGPRFKQDVDEELLNGRAGELADKAKQTNENIGETTREGLERIKEEVRKRAPHAREMLEGMTKIFTDAPNGTPDKPAGTPEHPRIINKDADNGIQR